MNLQNSWCTDKHILPTFRPTCTKVQFNPRKMDATVSPETSVLGNIPEEQRSHLHRAGSLVTHILLGPIVQIARRHNTNLNKNYGCNLSTLQRISNLVSEWLCVLCIVVTRLLRTRKWRGCEGETRFRRISKLVSEWLCVSV